MSIKQELAYRAKTIAASVGLAVVGLAEWLVSSPDTAAAIQQVIPAPYTQLVPVILGAVGAVLVHQWPNGAQPSTAAAAIVQEPPTDTTILKLSAVNGGEFSGPPAH